MGDPKRNHNSANAQKNACKHGIIGIYSEKRPAKKGRCHHDQRRKTIGIRLIGIVRHLVLPGCRKDSMQLLEALASLLPVGNIRLSLMRQFTPDFVPREDYPELCRRLTAFEYESVLKKADELGFIGYSQSAEAASAEFTPEFCSAEAFELLDKN